MAINSLLCADVPLSNYSLTFEDLTPAIRKPECACDLT